MPQESSKTKVKTPVAQKSIKNTILGERGDSAFQQVSSSSVGSEESVSNSFRMNSSSHSMDEIKMVFTLTPTHHR